MIRSLLLSPVLLGAIFLLSNASHADRQVSSRPPVGNANAMADSVVFAYTAQVKAIIDKKCYECHNAKSTDEEAREDLDFDKLPKMSKTDQVYALDDIIETLEKNEMPPSKHIRSHPEDKLTDAETKLLMSWANDLANKLYE